MMGKQNRLLIPGPTECPVEVLTQMSRQVVPHYEAEWASIYWDINRDLQTLMGTASDVFPINGSGTLAVDIAMAGVISPGDRVLVIHNDRPGGFLSDTARSFGARVTDMDHERYQPVDPDHLRACLEQDDYKMVLTFHHESSSGFLFDIKEIAEACRSFDTLLLVDAVSSLGGVPFEMDAWGVDFCCSSVQKCLDCPPGLALVGVSQKAWGVLDQTAPLHRGRYMDLRKWRDTARELRHIHPDMVTVATNNMMALRTSLKHILAKGVDMRLARYQRLGRFLRHGLKNMNLGRLVKDEYAPLLTSVVFPDGVHWQEPRNFLSGRYDLLVGVPFRIAHFGSNVSEDYMTLALVAIEDYMRSKGFDVPRGSALDGLEGFRG